MGTFRFKQFAVADDQATMKVGTDAVLLGAWCPVGNATRLLDIGTGSGVIALMLAQRSSSSAHVDAVEMNEQDVIQAEENVRASPWAKKVHVIHGTIQEHAPDYGYDLIVSNPPYFSNSLLPPDRRRMEARHDVNLSQQDLVNAGVRLLGDRGVFCVILPVAEASTFRELCIVKGLHLQRVTRFKTRTTKPPERELMAFGQMSQSPLEDELVLYENENTKSKAYQALTRDFYL